MNLTREETRYTWLLEVSGRHSKRIHLTTHCDGLRVANVVYRPLPFQLEGLEERCAKNGDIFPETVTLNVRGDDLEARSIYQEIGNPVGLPVALRRVTLHGDQDGSLAADYYVSDAASSEQGIRCCLRRSVSTTGQHFTRFYRIVRKIRRCINELRSIYEEHYRRTQVKSSPVTINLAHTSTCNLRCVMCEQAFGVSQRTMDMTTYRRARESLFDRASVLDLTVMGDPFCAPKPFVHEILSDVEKYDLRLTMTTNATLLPVDEELDRIVGLASKITISFDGATKETFEKIRVGARWENTVANIERLNRSRLRQRFYRRPIVGFNFVVMRSNLHELPLFVETASRWGGSHIAAFPIIAVHPSLESEVLDVDSPIVGETLEEAHDKALRLGVDLDTADLPFKRRELPFPDRVRTLKPWVMKKLRRIQLIFPYGLNPVYQKYLPKLDRSQRKCPFLWNKVYIAVGGHVHTCCHPNFLEAGNLRERDFQEIWNGKVYSHLRKALNSDEIAAPCKDCRLLR